VQAALRFSISGIILLRKTREQRMGVISVLTFIELAVLFLPTKKNPKEFITDPLLAVYR